MSNRGRPRKPTALKLLTGNPGKRKLPKEREVEHGEAVKPDWLANDPVGSPVWDRLAPSRIAIGLLTELTSEAFAQMCAIQGEFHRNRANVGGHELAHLRALQNAFGFDPSALAKLGIATAKKEKSSNPFADLA